MHVKSIVKAASNGSSPTHNGPEKSKEGGKKEVEKVAKKLNWAAQKWIVSTAQLISLFFIRPGILQQKRSRRMLGIHFAFRNIIPNWPRNPKKHNNNLCLRSPYFWATYSERHQGAHPIWRGLWSFPRIKFVFQIFLLSFPRRDVFLDVDCPSMGIYSYILGGGMGGR